MKILLVLKHWQLFILLSISIIFPANTTVGQIINSIWFPLNLIWDYTIIKTVYKKIKVDNKNYKQLFQF